MKIGDSVYLRSGSTEMTVEGFRDNGRVVCVWFDPRHRLHRSAFPQEALVKARR